MPKVIERVKCEHCNITFGRTKTGRAWRMRMAGHMVRMHGADPVQAYENID